MKSRAKETPKLVRYAFWLIAGILILWILFFGRNSFLNTMKLSRKVDKLEQETETLKKLHRHDEGIQQAADPKDRDELVRRVATEIGDTVVYLDLLAQRLGLRLEDCVRDTFNRVSIREGFPERIDVECELCRSERAGPTPEPLGPR